MSLELKARLTLDRRGFVQGMNHSQRDVQAWNRVLEKSSKQSAKATTMAWTGAFAAIGGVVVGGFRAISNAVKSGGKFQDMSDRLGMNPVKLQQWGFAAEQTGSNAEAVTLAIQRLAVAGQQALGGSDEYAAALDRLGLSMDELRNLSLEDQFELLRMGMRNAKIDGEKLADVLKVLGRGAGELVPFLKSGSEWSYELTTDQVAKLDAMGDTINLAKNHLTTVAKSYAATAGGFVLNLLTHGQVERRKKANLKSMEEAQQNERGKALGREEAKAQEEAEKEANRREKEEAQKAERIARLEEARDKTLRDLQESRATTPEAKLGLLKSRLEEAKKKANNLLDKEGALEAAADANRIQQEIEGLQRNQAATGFTRGPGDALLSIGNFLGAGFNTLGGANTAVNELRAIKQELVQIKEGQKTQKAVRLEVNA